MYTKYVAAAITAGTLIALPFLASAHERQLFNIGGTNYLFVVGSLGEPVVVDDKSGLDLRVKIADPADPTNANAAGSKPQLGLESTLKVEMSAGDKKKTFDISTVWNDPGAYKAIFYPTIKTSFSYRVFGTINNTPVNLTFTCAPEGSVATEDKSEVKISEGVTRTYKNGQFGCPLGKEELGFPEDAMTVLGVHEDLHGDLAAVEEMITPVAKKVNGGIVFGLVGTILGAIALVRTRKPKAV